MVSYLTNGVRFIISVYDLLKDSPINYDTIIGMVDISEAQQKEFSVTYGDILFQRSSENYEDAGTSNVYLDHTTTAPFSGFIICVHRSLRSPRPAELSSRSAEIEQWHRPD